MGSRGNFFDASNAYANNGDNFISFQYIFGGSKQYVRFKAFITDYKDDFAVTWNSEQVYGRNDPIMTFQNTVRTLNLSWEVPSADEVEGLDNLKRAAQLMRFCYPTYEDSGNANTISKPPLLRIKFKNFMKKSKSQGLLAAIKGFSFSPEMESGFYDPTSGPAAADTLVPKTLKFSCTMTVLHEKAIGWNISKKGSTSFWSGPGSFPFLPEGATVESLKDKNALPFDPVVQESEAPGIARQKHEEYLWKSHITRQELETKKMLASREAKAQAAMDARTPQERRQANRRQKQANRKEKVAEKKALKGN